MNKVQGSPQRVIVASQHLCGSSPHVVPALPSLFGAVPLNVIPKEKQRRPGFISTANSLGASDENTLQNGINEDKRPPQKKKPQPGQSIHPSLSFSIATFTHYCSLFATGEHPDWAKPWDHKARPFHRILPADWSVENRYYNLIGCCGYGSTKRQSLIG